MLRSMFCFSIAIAGLPGLSVGSAYQQDNPKIYIEGVTNAKLPDSPHIFDVKGRVTIPTQTEGKDDLVVMVYTQSEEGDNIQLQTVGKAENGTQQPRKAPLAFDNAGTASWKMRIWLGSKGIGDPSYTVYAVAVKAFGINDGKRLIDLTNNKFLEFEGIASLLQKAGFRPITWTIEKGVQRNG